MRIPRSEKKLANQILPNRTKKEWRTFGVDLCKRLGIKRWGGAPKVDEIAYMYTILKHEKPKRVLSCGMGCTTTILNQHGPEVFVAVENKPPKDKELFNKKTGKEILQPWRESVEALEKEFPNLIRYDDWREVDGTYDFFLLDSSAGVNGWEGCRQHHRHDGLCYAMPLLKGGATVICHDWNCRINQQTDKLLDSKYFRLVHSYSRVAYFKINKKWWLERPSPTKAK